MWAEADEADTNVDLLIFKANVTTLRSPYRPNMSRQSVVCRLSSVTLLRLPRGLNFSEYLCTI